MVDEASIKDWLQEKGLSKHRQRLGNGSSSGWYPWVDLPVRRKLAPAFEAVARGQSSCSLQRKSPGLREAERPCSDKMRIQSLWERLEAEEIGNHTATLQEASSSLRVEIPARSNCPEEMATAGQSSSSSSNCQVGDRALGQSLQERLEAEGPHILDQSRVDGSGRSSVSEAMVADQGPSSSSACQSLQERMGAAELDASEVDPGPSKPEGFESTSALVQGSSETSFYFQLTFLVCIY